MAAGHCWPSACSGVLGQTTRARPPRRGDADDLLVQPDHPSSPTSTSTTGTTSPTSSPDSSRSAQPRPPPRSPTRRVTVATGIDVPWSLGFLPDGSALMTDARLRQSSSRSGTAAKPVSLGKVPGVRPRRRGRPLGVAVSPDFAQDQRDLRSTSPPADDNRVVRMTFERGEAEAPDADPRPAFPRQATTTAAGSPSAPTATSTSPPATPVDRPSAPRTGTRSGGKILRITPDGKPAPGQPVRRLAGLVLRPPQRAGPGVGQHDGRMFASEFGQNTWDELNLIKPGQNYGWPVVEGAGRDARTSSTRCGSGAPTRRRRAASPSGRRHGVHGGAARRVAVADPDRRPGSLASPSGSWRGEYGRLRDVAVGPDGRLWVLTNNTSRGSPSSDDDRVLVIPESTLR